MGEPSHSKQKKKFAMFPIIRGRDKNKQGLNMDQLDEMYFKLLRSKDLREKIKKRFQLVRIMVIGRSGSGKSTLIRLMVGDDSGPRTISNAKAGKQDIDREWKSTNPYLPVIFHDTNGMDVNGRERLTTIEKFLKKRQKNEIFSEQIHLIWYVINGTDNRFLDDGGAMQLVSSYKIPVLIIITHNDYPAHVQQVVTESAMSELLSLVADRQSDVRKQVIKVANHVIPKKDGELERVQVDWEALRRLSEATKQHLDRKLIYTWAAMQAVDMNEKMDASAKLIVRHKKMTLLISPVTAIPPADAMNVSLTLINILKSLCTIWRVPENFERALYRYVAMPEGMKNVCETLLRSMLTAAGLTLAISATVLTGGIALPSILGLVGAFGVGNTLRGSMLTLISFSSLILGCILYAKSVQVHKDCWDVEKSVDDYKLLCDKFSTSSFENNLLQLMKKCHSTWDTMMQTKKQRGKIRAALGTCFQELLLKRPNSLYTVAGLNHSSKSSEVDKLLEYDYLSCSRDNDSPVDSGSDDDE